MLDPISDGAAAAFSGGVAACSGSVGNASSSMHVSSICSTRISCGGPGAGSSTTVRVCIPTGTRPPAASAAALARARRLAATLRLTLLRRSAAAVSSLLC